MLNIVSDPKCWFDKNNRKEATVVLLFKELRPFSWCGFNLKYRVFTTLGVQALQFSITELRNNYLELKTAKYLKKMNEPELMSKSLNPWLGGITPLFHFLGDTWNEELDLCHANSCEGEMQAIYPLKCLGLGGIHIWYCVGVFLFYL